MQIVLIVLASVGLPFFALSTTGPLLQVWYHRATQGASPYRLYALSNAGSLMALLTYPFLIEPALPLAKQSVIWSALFVLFAVVVGTCGIAALRAAPATAVSVQATVRQPSPPVARGRPALWFALGFLPSAMLLAATNQICLDVASVPFLWVLPLSLYLLSFILTFDSPRWYSRRVYPAAFGLSAAGMAWVLNGGGAASAPLQAAVYLCGLFTCAMLCHGELARLKPDPAQLTTFYVVIAAAGCAGGVFVAVLAPLLFDSFLELHQTILGTLGLMLLLFRRDPAWRLTPGSRAWAGRASVAAALAIAAGLGYGVVQERADDEYRSRDFYGVLRITRMELSGPDDAIVKLVHGRIIHGAQFTSATRRGRPTLYYGRRSGAGLALQHHASDGPRRIGVVGLGAGTLAVYGRKQDSMCFFEINPEVARLAREHFTYLSDSPAACEVVLGDARLALEAERQRGGSRGFDVLALDAFSSDAIPTHLLTREAVQLYLAHLRSDGILAVHLSNQHFDLTPVLAEFCRSEGLFSRVVADKGDVAGAPSLWVLLSRNAAALAAREFEGFPRVDRERLVAWTDAHCSLLSVLRPVTPERLQFVASGGIEFETQFARGIGLLEKGDLTSAEQAFRSALEIDPEHAGAWLHLGNALQRAARRDEAADCFEQALRLDPSSSEAHNNLGGLLASRDPDRAAGLLRSALRLDARNAEAHSNLANILARQGRLAEALKLYEQALRIDPDLGAARQNMALVQQWLEDSEGTSPPMP
jgi:tetratricopeptide (TPR) repeat protein